MQLMIRFVCITGWRQKDIRLLHDSRIAADAVRVRTSKSRGRKKQAWAWTPELKAIVDEARRCGLCGRSTSSPRARVVP